MDLDKKFPEKLPDLPYSMTALEPYISEKTLGFHYGKHHKAYVDKSLGMLPGTPYENLTLREIIQKAAKDTAAAALFNNVAQAWNHDFYWRSMKPGGGKEPSGKIAEKIAEDFGEYAKFREEFAAAAAGQFGSGWAWLVDDGGKLKVIKTLNADNPVAHGLKPILTLDVWEHAYYLDYQNKRPDYIATYLDHLVNWEFAESNL